MQTTWFESWYD